MHRRSVLLPSDLKMHTKTVFPMWVKSFQGRARPVLKLWVEKAQDEAHMHALPPVVILHFLPPLKQLHMEWQHITVAKN